MNKRTLASALNALKLKMMDRDIKVCQMLKEICIEDRNIYVAFQALENELKENK